MSVTERMDLARKLGLAPICVAGSEWIGNPVGGRYVQAIKVYWMHNKLPHSGPFTSLDAALNFLATRCRTGVAGTGGAGGDNERV